MRRLAHHYMRRERPNQTLQTSALINEAYLKLVDHKGMQWQNQAHFYAVAAQAMRRILVDRARIRDRAKRKADLVNLDEVAEVAQKQPTDLLALDEALRELDVIDPRKTEIVVMKFFGGMTDQEIADAKGISTATVSRDWKTAKAWLMRAISSR